MSLLRRDARRDANEPDLIKALEQLGFHVERLSGIGIPDLLLSRGRLWYTAEIKVRKGRETQAQKDFRARAKAPIPIFRTIDDVIAWERGLT